MFRWPVGPSRASEQDVHLADVLQIPFFLWDLSQTEPEWGQPKDFSKGAPLLDLPTPVKVVTNVGNRVGELVINHCTEKEGDGAAAQQPRNIRQNVSRNKFWGNFGGL